MMRRIPDRILSGVLLLIAAFAWVPARSVAAPMRIVALNPLVAEWTAALLGDESSSKKIVGVTDYSTWPPVLRPIPTVGPYPKPDVERIAALKPDLVLASEEYNRPTTIEPLRRLKLEVKVLSRERFTAFGEWILELGAALGEPERAEKLRLEWERELKSLRTGQAVKKSFFLEIQHVPLITAGGSSFLSEAFEAAGYRNVFRESGAGYPKVSTESVIRAAPDRIFVLGHEQGELELSQSRKDWERFGKRIEVLPGDDFARCSLRLLNALKRLKSQHGP